LTQAVQQSWRRSLIWRAFDALLSVTEDGIIDYNITDDTYYFTSNAMMHLGITAFDTFESILERIDPEDQDLFKSAWQSIVNGNNSEISIFVKYDHIQDYNFTFIKS